MVILYQCEGREFRQACAFDTWKWRAIIHAYEIFITDAYFLEMEHFWIYGPWFRVCVCVYLHYWARCLAVPVEARTVGAPCHMWEIGAWNSTRLRTDKSGLPCNTNEGHFMLTFQYSVCLFESGWVVGMFHSSNDSVTTWSGVLFFLNRQYDKGKFLNKSSIQQHTFHIDHIHLYQ